MSKGEMTNAKWVVKEALAPRVWIGPSELDFGQLYLGAEPPPKLLHVRNLGDEEVQVQVKDVPDGVEVIPKKLVAVEPGHLGAFKIYVRSGSIDRTEDATACSGDISLQVEPVAREDGSQRVVERQVRVKAKFRRLPELVVEDAEARKIDDSLPAYTVSPFPEPTRIRLRVRRDDGDRLDLTKEHLSKELRHGSEVEDYSSCLDIEAEPDPKDPSAVLLCLVLHTHNLPPGDLSGSVGFWLGREEPPVQPRRINLHVKVQPASVHLAWPPHVEQAIDTRTPLTIPDGIAGWLPVKVRNPRADEARVRLRSGTAWLSFQPSEVTVPAGGEADVKALFLARTEPGGPRSSGAQSCLAWFDLELLDRSGETVDRWRNVIHLRSSRPPFLRAKANPEPVQTSGTNARFELTVTNETDVYLDGEFLGLHVKTQSGDSTVTLEPRKSTPLLVQAFGIKESEASGTKKSGVIPLQWRDSQTRMELDLGTVPVTIGEPAWATCCGLVLLAIPLVFVAYLAIPVLYDRIDVMRADGSPVGRVLDLGTVVRSQKPVVSTVWVSWRRGLAEIPKPEHVALWMQREENGSWIPLDATVAVQSQDTRSAWVQLWFIPSSESAQARVRGELHIMPHAVWPRRARCVALTGKIVWSIAERLRRAEEYLIKGNQLQAWPEKQWWYSAALSLVDSVLAEDPANDDGHWLRACILSRAIRQQPDPLEEQLAQEMQWIVANSRFDWRRREARAAAKRWGFPTD